MKCDVIAETVLRLEGLGHMKSKVALMILCRLGHWLQFSETWLAGVLE